MNNDANRPIEVLNQLKSGAILVKQKSNGKKYSRRFYLDEREGFVSYRRSHKVFGKARVCKLQNKNKGQSFLMIYDLFI